MTSLLVEPQQIQIQSAVGFAELSMWGDCERCLDHLEPFIGATAEVLILRAAAYQGLGKWASLRRVTAELMWRQPNDSRWAIAHATAVRALEGLAAAKRGLVEARRRLPQDGAVLYQIACYSSLMSQIAAARHFLKLAFKADPRLRACAVDDDDLEALWSAI